MPNYNFINESGPLVFPNYLRYPHNVKEIFEYFKVLIKREDL
jgi:hypothetical protein